MAAPKKVVEPKEEVKVEPKVEAPKEVKYRCDFDSWEAYHNYKGPKA